LLPSGPPLRPMSTTPSAAPFSKSCSQLDLLIKKLESDLGVQEPFDVKKTMSAQGKHAGTTAAAAPAAPHKPAPAATPGADAAAGGAPVPGSASAQDTAAKPKKEKVDKPAAPPKAPPVRTRRPLLLFPASFIAGCCCPRHRKDRHASWTYCLCWFDRLLICTSFK
jgi:hypothetical protein